MAKFSANFASVGKQVSLVGAGITAAVGGAATAALVSWTKSSLESIDAVSKLSDQLGVSTEALSSWNYAAGLVGVSTSDLESSLQKMSVVIGDARNGVKTASDAFEKLGIDIKNSGDNEATFRQIAQAISEIDDPAAKASAAVDIFGRSGTKLLNFLNQGEAGLAKFEEEAEKLGITFSRVDGAQVEMANDALARLSTVTAAIGNKLAIELAPIITAIAEKFVDASGSGINFGDYVSTALDWVVKGIGVVLDPDQANS